MRPTSSFSSFTTNDLAAAQAFYRETLGLTVDVDEGMGLDMHLPGGGEVFIYERPDHQPAGFTVLNFVVDDIDAAVDGLIAKGLTMERYEGMHQDDKGIARGVAAHMGPDIAWFKDPAGNILSVLHIAN